MAENNQKDLSMDEILASIRSILQDSATDKPAEKNDEEEVFDLSSSMVIEENKAAEAKKFEIGSNLQANEANEFSSLLKSDDNKVQIIDTNISDFEVQRQIDDQLIEIVDDEHIENLVKDLEHDAGISDNIADNLCLNQTSTKSEPAEHFEDQMEFADIISSEDKPNQDKLIEDISAEIISSFAKLFDGSKIKPAKNEPKAYDADRLLEEIIYHAVEQKINGELIFGVVKEKVIPVLDAWLKLYLPKIVEREVERVMVKVDKD